MTHQQQEWRSPVRSENKLCHSLLSDVADICYNMQYFEKHERDTHDPWSCRQSVVYHRYFFDNASSIWLVVQPPRAWESGLDDLQYDLSSHPLVHHLRFIRAAAANLRAYLNSISQSFLDLVYLLCEDEISILS
jgi:hypothetical protein